MNRPKGLIPIETHGNINWNEIRAEYIGGGISYRKLAEKHGISKDMIAQKAKKQGWQKDRATVQDKAATKIIQRAANAVTENVEIAADIKRRLLLRLRRIEEKYPMDATEVRSREGNKVAVFRIKDLTAAFRDLTDGMKFEGQDNDYDIKRERNEIEKAKLRIERERLDVQKEALGKGSEPVENTLLEAIKQSVVGMDFKSDIPEGMNEGDDNA